MEHISIYKQLSSRPSVGVVVVAKTGGLHELRGSSGVGVRVYRCWLRLPVIWKLAPAAVEVPPPPQMLISPSVRPTLMQAFF